MKVKDDVLSQNQKIIIVIMIIIIIIIVIIIKIIKHLFIHDNNTA